MVRCIDRSFTRIGEATVYSCQSTRNQSALKSAKIGPPNTKWEYDHVRRRFSFLPQEDQLWGSMPVSQQCRLEFSHQEGFVGLGDYQFNKIFGDNFFTEIPKEQFDQLIKDDIIESCGNKIGGYASFSQTDVRELAPVREQWLLLLQVDRAKNADIMWGDGGAGNLNKD